MIEKIRNNTTQYNIIIIGDEILRISQGEFCIDLNWEYTLANFGMVFVQGYGECYLINDQIIKYKISETIIKLYGTDKNKIVGKSETKVYLLSICRSCPFYHRDDYKEYYKDYYKDYFTHHTVYTIIESSLIHNGT